MAATRPPGRPRVSSRQNVEAAAVELFLARGFEQTTVDDIAAAAGIGRSTFFRYFRTKADVLWLPFDAHFDLLAAALAKRPADEPLTTSIIRGVMEALRESGCFELRRQAAECRTSRRSGDRWKYVTLRRRFV